MLIVNNHTLTIFKQMVEENGYTLKDVVKAAETHFRHLSGKYKQQVSETAAAKREQKKAQNKVQRRKDTKYAWRVNAAHRMEEKRGDSAKGCVTLVDKGWMSSDNDEPGNVDKSVWEKRVSEVSAGTKVWETHRLLWRDPKVSMLLKGVSMC